MAPHHPKNEKPQSYQGPLTRSYWTFLASAPSDFIPSAQDALICLQPDCLPADTQAHFRPRASALATSSGWNALLPRVLAPLAPASHSGVTFNILSPMRPPRISCSLWKRASSSASTVTRGRSWRGWRAPGPLLCRLRPNATGSPYAHQRESKRALLCVPRCPPSTRALSAQEGL